MLAVVSLAALLVVPGALSQGGVPNGPINGITGRLHRRRCVEQAHAGERALADGQRAVLVLLTRPLTITLERSECREGAERFSTLSYT